jgi:hypothetical protein
MPVNYRAGDERVPPAWRWALMTGTPPPCRLPGWVTFEQSAVRTPTGFDRTVAADRVWARHCQALMAEAKAHDFEPYWHQKVDPAGRGFRAWCDRFLEQHRY